MEIESAVTHTPKKGNQYFFDCNIWMYLFYQNGSYQQEQIRAYSNLYNRIVNAKADIIITPSLLAEFANTFIKTEFYRLAKINSWDTDLIYYKNVYKKTEFFSDSLRELSVTVRKHILPKTKLESDNVVGIDWNSFFSDPDTFDFNDRLYTGCLAGRGVFIVTNDSDFSHATGMKIITRNSSLLATGI